MKDLNTVNLKALKNNKPQDVLSGLQESLLTLFQRIRKSANNFDFSSLKNLSGSNQFNNFAVLALVLVVILLGANYLTSRGDRAGEVSGTSAEDQRITVPEAKASQEVNHEIQIPINQDDLQPIVMVIQEAELRDQIIVQGQRANSVEGRTFLIITLKLTNENSNQVSLNTRNFVRLSVNGNEEEWLAPEVHNDPVEVQAISTKYTRLGFPINDTDTNLKLRVGRVEGEKNEIELSEL